MGFDHYVGWSDAIAKVARTVANGGTVLRFSVFGRWAEIRRAWAETLIWLSLSLVLSSPDMYLIKSGGKCVRAWENIFVDFCGCCRTMPG